MTELERVIVDKPATSLEVTTPELRFNVQEVHESVIKNLFKSELHSVIKYTEGLETEKNKNSTLLHLIQDILLQSLDDHSINTEDKNAKAIYLQNKKITRELLINLMSIMKNYIGSDVSSKSVLLGKLIQSIHDRRY